MAFSTLQPAPGHTVLLFGPQFLSFTADSLVHLRSNWLELPGVHDWVTQTLSDLPRHWASVAEGLPILASLPGNQLLEDVIQFVRTGNPSKLSCPLPNLLLCPLVVVTQVAQYLQYKGLTDRGVWPAHTSVESVGFCTGLLSALAVSCSPLQDKLLENGAAAIRLAMLIGAIVDVTDAENKYRSVSLSAAWQSQDRRLELDSILEAFPETYVSVTYDENRVTVTTTDRVSDGLSQRLRAAGFAASKIGLQGRFHDPNHANHIKPLIEFCNSNPDFSLPSADRLSFRTRCEAGDHITAGRLHEIALRAILTDHCDWRQTFAAVKSEGSIITFGLERCVPHSCLREVSHRLVHMADVQAAIIDTHPAIESTEHDSIAVVGMSCKVPGADNLEEFWKLLCENKSQHTEVPSDRFTFDTMWRDPNPDRKWFGNFVNDFEAFDNKFFHKSPREAAGMDPQQKMMLQAAYQAVEQSGYFNSSRKSDRIGCYIGVSNVDYQDNVACYPATAYTATGTLMSFAAGKVSHYFGWTGPAMSIDTACSGSAVAVHEACKAILNGDCVAALAGGVNAITSPLWFQNLAGASFLSLTGQCKPFDARGDGYCRGEAVGAVFLKRLSTAIADGDVIFGTIAGTAVQQNQNCTAITVPNSSSLSDLFQNVLHRARLDPRSISVVEAHGTGTAVGDPAEYDSIRQVLGGQSRPTTLALRSVKGLIGHAECASGIVSLIKTLLMINERTIAPQASHETINPALNASPSDKIEISTKCLPWNADFRASCTDQ